MVKNANSQTMSIVSDTDYTSCKKVFLMFTPIFLCILINQVISSLLAASQWELVFKRCNVCPLGDWEVSKPSPELSLSSSSLTLLKESDWRSCETWLIGNKGSKGSKESICLTRIQSVKWDRIRFWSTVSLSAPACARSKPEYIFSRWLSLPCQ